MIKGTYDVLKDLMKVDVEAARKKADIESHYLNDFLSLSDRLERQKSKNQYDPYDLFLLQVYKVFISDKSGHHHYFKTIIDHHERAIDSNAVLRGIDQPARDVITLRAIDHVKRAMLGLSSFAGDSGNRGDLGNREIRKISSKSDLG